MEQFRYYRRGEGELDTSNFPLIFGQGSLVVDTLDEKTFMSLLAFNVWIDNRLDYHEKFLVTVKGYVAHMRSDKDEFYVALLYGKLNRLQLYCESIQHNQSYMINFDNITLSDILRDVNRSPWYLNTLGADGSVPMFFPDVNKHTRKIRENGKVVKMDVPEVNLDVDQLIVDDILGGGATIQQVVDELKSRGFNKKLYLWVRYNEGIHTEEFLNQFEDYYIGDKV